MSNMPPAEYRDAGRRRLSCRNCGYPVDVATLEEERPTPRRPKILCIDDDKLLLGLFTDSLAMNDFQPLTASDGPSGIELAAKERPDLILVDVMMPGMTGFDVCKALRADPALQRTPIIVLTALGDPRIEPKALAAGANLVVQKPYDTKRLIEVIRKTLA
jgi:CheY-like chemotaxis protein